MFDSWKDVIEQIVNKGILPKVLIYEKVIESNKNDDRNDQIDINDLYLLEQKVNEKQDFLKGS